MEIIFRYPLIFFFILLPLIYFGAKYASKEQPDLKKKEYFFILYLRILFISMLVMLIFQPFARWERTEQRNIEHLFFFDNSRSISNDADRSSMKVLLEQISEYPSFSTYKFGDSLVELNSSETLDFKDGLTKISSGKFKTYLNSILNEKDPGSINLVTDCNFTDHNNLSLRSFTAPLNILMTSPAGNKPDIFIKDIIYDDIIAEGTEVTYTVITGFRGSTNEKDFNLEIYSSDKKISSVNSAIPSSGSFKTEDIELDPKKESVTELEFRIVPLKDEENLFNNSRKTFQTRLRSEKNILVYSPKPSLDVLFFKRFLSSNSYNYKMIYSTKDIDKTDPDIYSIIVLFSPDKRSDRLLKDIELSRPLIVFAGEGTDINYLNDKFGTGIKKFRKYSTKGYLSDNVNNRGSYLLRYGDEIIDTRELGELSYNTYIKPEPSTFVPLLSYSNSDNTHALYQIRNMTKNLILINFRGFWYNLFDDEKNYFSKFLTNIIENAAADRSADRIKILPSKDEFYSGDDIVFRGKVLDAAFRSADNASVKVILKENSASTMLESGTAGEYKGTLNIRKPGIYNAVISAVLNNGTEIKKDVRFKVIPNDIELSRTGCDTVFAKNFAGSRNGKALSVDNSEIFIDSLRNSRKTVNIKNDIPISKNIIYLIILLTAFLTELAFRKYKDLS